MQTEILFPDDLARKAVDRTFRSQNGNSPWMTLDRFVNFPTTDGDKRIPTIFDSRQRPGMCTELNRLDPEYLVLLNQIADEAANYLSVAVVRSWADIQPDTAGETEETANQTMHGLFRGVYLSLLATAGAICQQYLDENFYRGMPQPRPQDLTKVLHDIAVLSRSFTSFVFAGPGDFALEESRYAGKFLKYISTERNSEQSVRHFYRHPRIVKVTINHEVAPKGRRGDFRVLIARNNCNVRLDFPRSPNEWSICLPEFDIDIPSFLGLWNRPNGNIHLKGGLREKPGQFYQPTEITVLTAVAVLKSAQKRLEEGWMVNDGLTQLNSGALATI